MKSAVYPTFATFSFVTPFENERISYQNGKKRLASCVKDDVSLKQGLILETIEKGVSYPVLHYSPLQPFTPIDRYGKNGLVNDFNKDYVIEQGVYRELESVRADLFGVPLDDLLTVDCEVDSPRPPWRRFYMVLGFKHLPVTTFTNVVENHWKDWTGARYLYLNMPSEFGLSRLTFYKRTSRSGTDHQNHNHQQYNDIGLFLYMVLAECVHVTQRDELPLLDFVQRMRAEHMPPYLALYEESEWQQAGGSFPLEPLWFRHRKIQQLPSKIVMNEDFQTDRTPVIKTEGGGFVRRRWSSGGSLGMGSPDRSITPEDKDDDESRIWSPTSYFRTNIGTVNF